MYYITKGFKQRGLPGGRFMAVLFSIFTILGALGGGNMFQANQAHAQLSGVLGGYPGWITGLVLAIVVFSVIVGGLKSIVRVTEKVVPFMAIFYVVVSLVILAINHDQILWAFGQIFVGAFTASASLAGSPARSSRASAVPPSRTRRGSAPRRSRIRPFGPRSR